MPQFFFVRLKFFHNRRNSSDRWRSDDKFMSTDLFDIRDKVTVITGSSGLLGSAISESIASKGGSLVLLDINNKALSNQKKNLRRKILKWYFCFKSRHYF